MKARRERDARTPAWVCSCFECSSYRQTTTTCLAGSIKTESTEARRVAATGPSESAAARIKEGAVSRFRQQNRGSRGRRHDFVKRRQRCDCPKRWVLASSFDDGDLGVVAHPAVDRFDVTFPQLGLRAGVVACRFGLSQRRPRQARQSDRGPASNHATWQHLWLVSCRSLDVAVKFRRLAVTPDLGRRRHPRRPALPRARARKARPGSPRSLPGKLGPASR